MNNNLFSRRAIVLIVIAAVLVLGLQFYSLSNSGKNSQLSIESLKEARLVLDKGNGAKREFAGPVVSGMKVLNALLQSAEAGSFEVNYRLVGNRLVVKNIDGKGEPAGLWLVYHNGRTLGENELAVESLSPGDLVSVVYIKK